MKPAQWSSDHQESDMPTQVRRVTVLACAVAALLTGFVACEKSPSTPSAKAAPEKPKAPPTVDFRDTNFGFTASAPEAWQNVPPTGVNVPGTVLKVWTPGPPASVVAFVQDPGQVITARQLLDSSAAGLKAADCTVTFEQVVKVAGKDAMSLKVTGPGNGAALGVGTVPTYQHWVAIPRDKRVLVLLFTAPDASKNDAAGAFETMISSLKVD